MKTSACGVIRWITAFQVIFLAVLGFQNASAATNISTTDKYAWNENLGWQNWRSTNAQATVGTTYLVGYVWAENIGWIKLGHTPWAGGQYINDASDNWGVNRNESTGALSGYAWSENAGWINFNPTNGGVTIAKTDPYKFDGYAWGENIGWIHFQNVSPEAYAVALDGPLVVVLVSFTAQGLSDQVVITWETASEIDNAGFHVWRSETEVSGYQKITDSLIPAEGFPTQGASYEFIDRNVESGKTYHYKLEDIDTSGGNTLHGPVSAWAGVVNIQVKGTDGPVTVAQAEPVQVEIQMNTTTGEGAGSERWICCDTSFGWFSCIQPHEWVPGIQNTKITPAELENETEVLKMVLPKGEYTFYFATDKTADSNPEPDWIDSVEVTVE